MGPLIATCGQPEPQTTRSGRAGNQCPREGNRVPVGNWFRRDTDHARKINPAIGLFQQLFSSFAQLLKVRVVETAGCRNISHVIDDEGRGIIGSTITISASLSLGHEGQFDPRRGGAQISTLALPRDSSA